jgi:hypothetical protein
MLAAAVRCCNQIPVASSKLTAVADPYAKTGYAKVDLAKGAKDENISTLQARLFNIPPVYGFARLQGKSTLLFYPAERYESTNVTIQVKFTLTDADGAESAVAAVAVTIIGECRNIGTG